jgi:DNA-directed RNA polymerase beta subunit
MRLILQNLEPYEFELINGERLKVSIENCEIKPPRVTAQIDVKEKRIFPAEARQRAVTYTGNCSMSLAWSKNGSKQGLIDFDLGPIPIMIRVSASLTQKNHFLPSNRSRIPVKSVQPLQFHTRADGEEARA